MRANPECKLLAMKILNLTVDATVDLKYLALAVAIGAGLATASAQNTDLAITNTVNNATPKVGSQVVFTLTAANHGPSAATGVSVIDQIPGGYAFVSANPAVAYNGQTWTVGALANGATATLQVTAKVNATGNYFSTAIIMGNQADPDPGNNTATATTTPVPQSDLAITKTVNNDKPNVGSQVIFTLTATNHGPSAATDVSVSDAMPAGYEFVSATPAWAYNALNGIWTIGSLANGATATLQIAAKVNATGNHLNAATISGTEQDPDPSNNTASLAIQEEAGKVTYIRGIVNVKRNGIQRPLLKDDSIFVGDIVSTEAASFLKVIFQDSSVVSVGPNSLEQLDKFIKTSDGSYDFSLQHLGGIIRSEVTKRNKNNFEIKTKTCSNGVRGTDFEVEYQELDGVATTTVSVSEGIVDVTEDATGRITALTAGETLRILSNLAVPVPSIISSWFLPDGVGGGTIVTFLANGEYLYFRDGDSVSDPVGQDGMERGTYSWNPAAGTLSATVLVDTNGQWGFSHGVALQPSVPAVVSETTLEFTVPGKGTSTFSRVGSGAPPLLGSWYVVGGTRAGGVAAVTFLADGSYYFAQDGDPAKDSTGTDGGERGSFTWDSGTGALAATAAVDTCGQWGLSHLGANPTAVLRNNYRTLILSGGNLAGPVTFQRVCAFDGSFESWKSTHALFGANGEANATPFGDGIPNVLRYTLNLDTSFPPQNYLPVGQVVDISGTGNLAMEFRARKNIDGAILTPQFSTTLDNWQPVPAENIHRLADDDIDTERHVVRMPLSGPQLFLRLAATVPES